MMTPNETIHPGDAATTLPDRADAEVYFISSAVFAPRGRHAISAPGAAILRVRNAGSSCLDGTPLIDLKPARD
jgi:hypothetical protein